MTLAQDLQQPVLPAVIELFDIDALVISGTVYRFTPMTNAGAAVVWGGNTYLPIPIRITGVNQTSAGAPARPKLEVTNIDHFFGALASTLQDMVGAKVIYRHTFSTYLGTSISSAPMTYTINKKLSQNKTGISFELKSALDLDRAKLPKRQMLRDGVDGFPGLGINKRTS